MPRTGTKTGGICPECDSKKTRTRYTRSTDDLDKVCRHRVCQDCGHTWYRIEQRQERKRRERRVSPTIARWCAEILEHGHVLEGAQ